MFPTCYDFYLRIPAGADVFYIPSFNILDAMKHPFEDHSIFHIDIIDDAIDEHISDFYPLHWMKYASVFELSEFACIGVDSNSYYASDSDFDVDSEFDSLGVVPYDFNVTWSEYTNHVVGSTYAYDCYVEVHVVEPISPSPQVLDIEQASNTLELKLLLDTSSMSIGWTLAHIPGISPSTCMHKILLEDGANLVRQPQRRLNPIILKVVKKEVTKLQQAGIIYPILDN